MSQIITDFKGMIPALDPEKLPDNAAQYALNCALRGGTLSPLKVASPFFSMHDESGILLPGIPEADLIRITKPAAPSLSSTTRLCNPASWLDIYAVDWVSYVDSLTGQTVITNTRYTKLTIQAVKYTETGMFIEVYLPDVLYTFPYGGPYFLRGPRYQFKFSEATNGPDEAINFPFTPCYGDPEFPPVRVPLVDEDDNVYAYFQVVDVRGPNYDEDILVSDYAYLYCYFPSRTWLGGVGAYPIFQIELNYAYSARRHFYYVQSMVTADEQEGPPSEVSDRIVVRPGTVPTLSTPRSDGYTKNKLYRSTTSGDDFLLVDDVDADTYKDNKPNVQNVEIPPYGNYPALDEGDDDPDDFLRGSFIHPAQFAVAYYGDTLYLSDHYRFHAWPDENTVPFVADIDAIALSGNTILVWGDDNQGVNTLWGIAGSNPTATGKYEISKTAPLLSVAGLCKIGQTVFFPTRDGLAAVAGGQVQIITEDYFTREQWTFLSPASMVCTVADGSIFIESTTAATPVSDRFAGLDASTAFKMRFDLAGGALAAVSFYTTTDASSLTWQTKRHRYKQETVIDFVRVVADATATVTLYANRVEVWSGEITSARPVSTGTLDETTLTPLDHAMEWEARVVCAGVVRELELIERVVHTIQHELVLTPENTPTFRAAWIKFVDQGRFAVGVLSAQTSETVPLQFFAGNELVHTESIANGRFFTLPRTVDKATSWMVGLDTDAHIDELFLAAKVTQPISGHFHEINDGRIPPWLLKRYEYTDEAIPASLIVHASSAVTMNLYFDGVSTPSEQQAVADGQEIRLDMEAYGALEWDFGGDDALVTEVELFVRRVELVGPEGLTLSNRPNWRGLLFKFVDRGMFAVASVGASSYEDVKLSLVADGETVLDEEEIDDGELIRLPRNMGEGALWGVDVASPDRIESLVLIPLRVQRVQGVEVHEIHPRTVPPWLYTIYEVPDNSLIRSARATTRNGSSVSIRIFNDGAESYTKKVSLTSGREAVVSSIARCGRFECDFNGDDADVTKMAVFLEDAVPIQNNGFVVRGANGRAGWRNKVLNFPDAGSFSTLRAVASSYTGMSVTLTALGETQATISPTDDGEIKLDLDLTVARQWTLDMAYRGQVHEVVLIGRETYPLRNNAVVVPRGASPWTWFDKRVLAPRPVSFGVARVTATKYPVTLTLFAAGTQVHSVAVADAKSFRLPRFRPERKWSFDATPASGGIVQEVGLAVGVGGLLRD